MTGIKRTQQSLFFNNRYIEKESHFADAIESESPIIYIHSLPPIPIYLKFGWILKALNVFAFYPIRYIMFLSLDVFAIHSI